MATRFYLPSATVADASPSFNAGWEDTTAAIRRKAVTARLGEAMTEKTVNADATSGTREHLYAQYVSDPLDGPQAVSGTVKGQILARHSNAAYDGRLVLSVSVCSGDGSTIRGVALELITGAPEGTFATTSTNRSFKDSLTTPVSLTNVDAQDGDRIVIEIGARETTTNTVRTGTLTLGDDNPTDLPEDETTTTQNNPWVEFSADFTFSSGGGRTTKNTRAFPLGVRSGVGFSWGGM